MPDALWTVTELAEYLRYSPRTVATHLSRSPEKLPPRVVAFDRPRWEPSLVMEWVLEQSKPKNRGGRPRKINPLPFTARESRR